MKPNFALRLAHDSIELLQRSSSGWLSVGSVRLDAPDLDASIGQLRDHARRLAPDGISTKLIIPDSELRYETVLAPGPDDAARKLQIEAAIDGLTPYSLDELIYDWVVEGDHAQVVIAARETLSEAEDFAAAQGFHPVSFVAMPSGSEFLGEPFFGATRHARDVLPAGTRVLPDVEPVAVVGRARIPAAQTMPAAAPAKAPPASEPAPSPAPPTAKAPEPPAAPEASEPAAAAKAPSTDTARDEARPAAEAAPAIEDPRKLLAARQPDQATSNAPQSAGVRPGVLQNGPRRPKATPAATAAAEPMGSVGDLVRRLGTRLRRERAADSTATEKPVSADPAPKTVARPDAAARSEPSKPALTDTAKPETAAPTFASRRGPGPALVSHRPNGGSTEPGPGGRIAVLPKSGAPDTAIRPRGAMARMGEALRRRLRPAAAASGATAAKAATAKPASAKPTEAKAQTAPSARPKQSLDRAAPKTPAPIEPIVPASRPPASEKEKAREAEALTIFGARSGGGAPGRDFARRGLVLTGGLLLLLIAVGIWAAYFVTAPDREIAETPAAEAPALAAAPPEEVTPPAPIAAEPEPTAPATEETAAAPLDEPVDSPVVGDPDSRLEALVQEALRQAEPADSFAEPEIAGLGPAAEPETGASAEGVASRTETLALPGPLQRPSINLPVLVSLPPPPPFGTQIELGEDGLVVATPEGAITAEGVTIFARTPSEVPPARPALSLPEPAAAPDADAPLGDDASAADAVDAPETEVARLEEPAPAADTALAAFRPLARPETSETVPAPVDLEAEALAAVAPTASEPPPNEDPALAGFRPQARPEAAAVTTEVQPAADDAEVTGEATTDAEAAPGAIALAALRPNPRPESLIERVAVAAPALAAEPEIDLSSATPQAVARSVLPSARPDDFASTVQRALAAAARRQAPAASQPQQAAAPQPQAQPPAQTQTAALQPQIPSSASVAETATERRAINLRRVNLIGIFGSQANRRALVRMPNGQVVRVQVGDTLDGGRVSAIGDGELRYVRGGRNQVLRIGQSG